MATQVETTSTTTTTSGDDVAASTDVASAAANKRLKTEVRLSDVLSEHILSKDLKDLKETYKDSNPYPWGRLTNLFQEGFLKQVIHEIKDNSKVNFKESDLFRVYQSIDLANLDQHENKDKMPTVMKLRSVLYGDEFRRFIEDFTDLPPGTLSEQVDCACNCHMTGCHLLCHDDVIGTRKISYILYLTEPEPEWSKEEGGALELYDSTLSENNKRVPDTIPCKCLLPIFNHLAFFVVEPGFSFHSVQEVLGDRPRLSIQGWYHAKEPPKNIEDATLQRLKSHVGKQSTKDEDTEGPFQPMEYNDCSVENNEETMLSPDDALYLSQFIQGTYLKPEAIQEIRVKFEEDSSIQLRHFLCDAWADKIRVATVAADSKNSDFDKDPSSPDYYKLGVTDAWSSVGPSHKQRFLEFGNRDHITNHPADEAGAILFDIRSKLLESPAFGRFLGMVTSLGRATASRGRIRRFRPGRDYTVAHYGLLTETPVLDATLCFAAGTGAEQVPTSVDDIDDANNETACLDEADEMWQSGDVGGFECYIEADEEDDNGNEPADEYNADDDTELLSVAASNNTLSLVYRDSGTMRFIKYLGSKAPSSRWDIAMEYEVPPDENNETQPSDEDEHS